MILLNLLFLWWRLVVLLMLRLLLRLIVGRILLEGLGVGLPLPLLLRHFCWFFAWALGPRFWDDDLIELRPEWSLRNAIYLFFVVYEFQIVFLQIILIPSHND